MGNAKGGGREEEKEQTEGSVTVRKGQPNRLKTA